MAYSLVKTFLALLLLAVVACVPATTQTNATNLTLTNLTSSEPVEPQEPVDSEPDSRDFSATLQFTEGDTIRLASYATDPDNDDVELSFTEPFDRNGVWQTDLGDAGDYPVTVSATDTKGATTTTRILVSVGFANRAPSLECPDSVAVSEGETVTIDCTTSDPDGDEVILSFSGFMQGGTYETDFDDAGEHTVTVSAEDGQSTTRKDIAVSVANVNRPPVLSLPSESFETTEFVPITIRANASDPDGDAVTVSFGSPLDDEGSWTPQLDQDGEYDIDVTVTDGEDTTVQTVTLTVHRSNRAPSITVPTEDGIIRVKEGDFIDLRTLLVIEDPENEEVIASYSGWMTGPAYRTGYDDAGQHVVSIEAMDDSDHVTTMDITIIVEDVNRPPVFVRPA